MLDNGKLEKGLDMRMRCVLWEHVRPVAKGSLRPGGYRPCVLVQSTLISYGLVLSMFSSCATLRWWSLILLTAQKVRLWVTCPTTSVVLEEVRAWHHLLLALADAKILKGYGTWRNEESRYLASITKSDDNVAVKSVKTRGNEQKSKQQKEYSIPGALHIHHGRYMQTFRDACPLGIEQESNTLTPGGVGNFCYALLQLPGIWIAVVDADRVLNIPSADWVC